ncbi:hypothetical protein [Streptomyces sp. BK239]|uniref:hypothetical protein n=1 Tax=Streptomyces sp. BK239 TaxID=2512155 RepID=UPI00102D08FA|nr:hypothetical protein [Streptomyces sp. BK239]RZU23714.1 hypothetical protein EV567_1450 [Streptomyces sp. BK239]
MAWDQLPSQMREFAQYLDGLLTRLDQGSGWCAVFWQRDPHGMRACLAGAEVPPWDVVEALLQDLAAEYGTDVAARDAEQARPLHAAAVAAHDARPGGRDALGDRLDAMLREQRHTAERQAEISRRLASAGTEEEVDGLRLDLAWAQDDHERATARCAELSHRLAELDRRTAAPQDPGSSRLIRPRASGRPASASARPTEPAGYDHTAGYHHTAPAETGGTGRQGHAPEAGHGAWPGPAGTVRAAETPTADAHSAPAPDEAADPAPMQRRRRRGSARFAGMTEGEDTAPVVVPPTAEPLIPAPTPVPETGPGTGIPSPRTPRGARFAGAAAEAHAVQEPLQPPRTEPSARPTTGDARPEGQAPDRTGPQNTEHAEVVERLVRLRGEGRSGEAHALLVELAYGPAARIPLLAAGFQRAGLNADWATLLWEAASLPAERLVAVADALTEAGRAADGEQVLRQGVVRPAEEVGKAVSVLTAQSRRREAQALLDAFVRVRTPEDVARGAEPEPHLLVPLLMEAARAVSKDRRRDLKNALKAAGFTP